MFFNAKDEFGLELGLIETEESSDGIVALMRRPVQLEMEDAPFTRRAYKATTGFWWKIFLNEVKYVK